MKVLITDMRHSSIEEEQRALAPAGITIETAFCRTEEELILRGQGAFAFLVAFAPVTRRVMESLPELKLIVRYGVGVDNVDLAAAREMGKKVARVPDYCVDEVAAHTLALILAGLRMLFPLSQAVRNGNWIENPSAEKLRRLASLTGGIVGLGRIGRRLAGYLRPLVAGLLFYDPYITVCEVQDRDWESVASLPELFSRCQLVSLHAPLNEQTHDLIDARVLAGARDLILVNTSRADLINRQALESAMNEGRISFFGADVFWQEPPDYTNPDTAAFLRRKNVLISPHMAWYSEESEGEVRRKAAEEVLRFAQGKPLLHPV